MLVARSPRAYQIMEYRSTAHGAHAVQCGLGVVVLWANAQRASPHAVGRGAIAPTPRQVSGTGFESSWPLRLILVARSPRAYRIMEYRPTANGAHAVQCGLGVVVSWANARRAPPHAVSRGSTALTPRQVNGTGFQRSWSPRSNPVAYVPRAFHPVKHRQAVYGAHAAQCGLGVVVLWANTGRAPPHAAGLSSTA